MFIWHQLVRCDKRQRIAPHVFKTADFLKHTAQCLSVIAPYALIFLQSAT